MLAAGIPPGTDPGQQTSVMVRNLLLLAHITSVAAWLGANVLQLVIGPRLRARGGEVARQWAETGEFLGRRYYNIIGALVAITGIALVMHGHWHWRGFVLVGIAMVVVGGVTGVAGFDKQFKREIAARVEGDEAAAKRAAHNITSLAFMDSFLLLITMLAMIDRWKGVVG
jgi:hypothetical protein